MKAECSAFLVPNVRVLEPIIVRPSVALQLMQLIEKPRVCIELCQYLLDINLLLEPTALEAMSLRHHSYRGNTVTCECKKCKKTSLLHVISSPFHTYISIDAGMPEAIPIGYDRTIHGPNTRAASKRFSAGLTTRV